MKGTKGLRLTIGQRIKLARERAELTQAEVAKRLGITRGAPSLWEIERAVPEPGRIAELARLLGVSTDFLLGLSDVLDGEPGMPDSVPALTPTEVAEWAAGAYTPKPSRERLQVSRPAAPGAAVAMQVTSNAMAPSFPVGSYVVISHDTPTSGAPVIVSMGRGPPMLRYLIDEGSTAMLSPENPQYPVIPLADGRVIGRVIEVIQRRTLL